MNEPVTIDPEFQSLIPPLSQDEYKQLEENCKRDGILDSLKVWKGILIDGHNRYRISQEWDLNYQVEEMEFQSREAVIRWIILNQFGRRNLSAYDRSILALKLKPVFAEKAKKKETERKTTYQKSEKSSLPKIDTTKQLAQIAGVSHDTINKVETIEQKAPEPLKEQVRSGQKTINQAWLEVKEAERKHADLSARAHLEAAQERHEEFQSSPTVTMEAVKQDKEDLKEIAESKAKAIRNALKKLLFIGAATQGGDADFSNLKKYLDESTIRTLNGELEAARSVIDTIRRCL